MDVGGWLRNLGLGQYEANFRDNKIDVDVLADLTDGDLEKLGLPLGDRKRLLKAIPDLVGLHSATRISEPVRTRPPSAAAQSISAERRPITVMFCDLVGSTSLAAKLDAEDWRNLVGSYLDEASAAVAGLGGHVLKKLGDGLMALFGYPHAQENDAERAVRAALAIQRALVEINARNASRGAPELSARIGLDSGQVVVDATGEVFGDAPNIAARVQSAAEPGSILITATVQRQTAGLFVAEDRGQHELKGLSAPMTLYRVVRASGGGRRGGTRALTPLVGREEELDLLARRWDRAQKGEGQLALIVGEPGLGKSRLMEEFHGRLGETPHTWVEWSSSQLLQNTPLHPIAEWGRQRFGVDLPTEQRLAELENTLGLIGLDPTEYAPLLAPLVDVLLPEDRVAKLAPEELRRRQLAAMTAWVLASARIQAVVLAFEDLQWADPTSLDLMRALAERGVQAPLLIIATARPEFRPSWSVRSHHSAISLSPLDRAQIAKMVRELSSRHALPKDIVEGVSERTGGVPLFVEEVTRLLLERGEQGGVQAIPPTLQQSLAARLDRLGSAREIAQIGAVLGRGFSYALLQSVAGLDEGALRSSLERLAEADILFVEGDGAQATYRFKHALIQDAAYDSLLKTRRQALHAQAAEILRESASLEPEAIAHHFTQAGLDDLAIEWWGKAGDQALRRSAFQEAISHLGKAIAMADKAGATSPHRPEDTAGSSQRLKLQTDYSQAMMFSKGYAAEETKVAFARAAELAGRTDDFSERFMALLGQYAAAATGGELRSAREPALTILREAEGARRVTEAAIANRSLGLIAYWHGDFIEARTHFERALDARDPNPDPKNSERFGDSSTWAASQFAPTAWALGEVERARELINSATQRASEIGHVAAFVDALFYKSYLEIWRGDPLATLSAAKALEVVARKHGVLQYLNEAELHSGWARGRIDDPTAGAAQVRRVLASFVDQSVRVNLGFYSGLLAELEAEALGTDSALARIDEAFRLSNEVEHRCSLPFLHRLRGEILLKRNPADPAPAEEAFRTSIAIAKEQSARSPVLLASLSLAELYQSSGRPADAHEVLAPALEGFSPTPEMPEIAEAQALLAALAATEEVKAAEAQRQRRLHLQTAYGQAMMWAKGFSAEETRAAFSRATELTAKADSFADRFAAGHFQWTFAFVRGELRSARELELSFLKEAEDIGRVVEAGVARRGLALACYQAADFLEARTHCERALEICDPECERETQDRFHDATGPVVMSVLAMTMWQLGEVERARELIEQANRRGSELGHGPSMAHPLWWKSRLEILRGDAAAGLSAAKTLEDLAREIDAPFWRTDAELLAGWARGRLRDAATGAEDLRRALAERVDQGTWGQGAWFDTPYFTGLVAELEAETLGTESALARVDEAMALGQQVETRCNLPFLHLLRGKLLLDHDQSNPARAEEAFQTALEIAKQQGARSWGLRAALSLAKLHQSTDRAVEAHAVLAPALDGFSPTPEMPEIAEAQALLTALAATDEVRAQVAQRHRLTQLQVSYGNALIAARGHTAPETTEAFAKVREFGAGGADFRELAAADYGLWVASYGRGELPPMRVHSAAFLEDVAARPDSVEACVAHRVAGSTHWFAGEYREAREHLERAVALFQPGRDDDVAFRFGQDAGVAATLFLAIVLWVLGDVARAIALAQQAHERIERIPHANTRAYGKLHMALFELIRGEVSRAVPNALELGRVAHENDLPLFRALAVFLEAWAKSQTAGSADAREEMSRAVDVLRERNIRCFDGPLKFAHAQEEARLGDPERAISIIDDAMADFDRRGHRAMDAELRRLRGEILLKRTPADPAPAEDAYRTAIAVAKQQGTRSFELRAALALAKLYQSTARPTDAHAVLTPALEGFAPTSEFPEIGEAHALLAALDNAGVNLAAGNKIRAGANSFSGGS